MAFQAYVNNDNAVTLAGLKDACTDVWANTATVTVRVTDKNGVDVTFDNTSDSWPRTLAYVAASNGVYCGIIPIEAELVAEQNYIAVIIANQAGIRGRWNVFFQAKHRNIIR